MELLLQLRLKRFTIHNNVPSLQGGYWYVNTFINSDCIGNEQNILIPRPEYHRMSI